MALDGLVEAIVEMVVKPLLKRAFYGLSYSIGWASLKLLTLGRYPPRPGTPHNREFVAMFAAVPLVVLLLAFTGQFG